MNYNALIKDFNLKQAIVTKQQTTKILKTQGQSSTSTSKYLNNHRLLNVLDDEGIQVQKVGSAESRGVGNTSFGLMDKSIWNFEKKDENLADFKQKFNILKEKDNKGRNSQQFTQPIMGEPKMVSIYDYIIYLFIFICSFLTFLGNLPK
jgi:hypothetical protein